MTQPSAARPPARADQEPGPVHPASSDDEHPLARLACTVGVLTDLLVINKMDPSIPEPHAASAATIAKESLDVAGTAATPVLGLYDPAIAERPLAVALYASRQAERLPLGPSLRGMQNPAVPTADREPLPPEDELELSIHHWASSARAELRDCVPSVELLKDITRTVVPHRYAPGTAADSRRCPGGVPVHLVMSTEPLSAGTVSVSLPLDGWTERPVTASWYGLSP